MKNLKKLFLMLGLLLGLFACSSLPTEENSASTTKSSVKFTMQNVANSTNSNILFSSTDEQTPSKVAISYKKSGEEEVTSTFIELQAFGSSYITSNTITLEVGDYYVTKFDVLNSSGNTIYSTPMKNSPTAIASGVTKALEYSFSVESGVSNTETMQVVEVDSTTDPYDFGFTDFTFEVFSYNKFYIVARVLDESTGWVHTEAIVTVANSEGATIKTDTISGAENKIIMAKEDSYKITISKNGYATQELSFTADSLEAYKSEPLIVNLQKNSNNITDGLVAYYPFNGNANDESGTGNNGTINGNITFSENGAYFDGSSYISVPSNSTLNPEKELTIAFWAKPIKFENLWGTLIFKGGGARSGWSNREYSVWINKNNFYYMASAGNNSNEITMYTNYEVLNNWVFYVGVIDRVNHVMKIYLNNELISTISDSYSSFNNNDNDLCIGHCEENLDIHANYNGYLDELRIYKKILSEEEITELFNEGH